MFPFWCSATPESERRADQPLVLLRVNVVLHGDYLLTVHRQEFDLPGGRGRVRAGPDEQYAVYVALDGMTDTVLDALAAIEHEIAKLETRLLASGFRPRAADKRRRAACASGSRTCG